MATRELASPPTPTSTGQQTRTVQEREFHFSDEHCPARRALDLVADKWTPLVILVLSSGTHRYNTLRRALPGVSQRMLTRSLRRLEAEGLASRHSYYTVPPTVEYSLTPPGLTMVDPLLAIARWGQSTLPNR